MSEKQYEFRELTSKDIFPMFKLLNKIGFKQFKECFNSDEVKKAIGTKEGVEAVGIAVVFDIAGIIVQNIPSCEDEIYKLLENVSNMKQKEIEKMPMAEFFEMIVDFIQKPEFKDFFKVVSRLFNSAT